MIARTCLLILITMAVQNPAPPELEAGFSRVFAMQQEIRDIHPAFQRLYPIAVVRGGSFHIYEPNAKSYRLATTAPDKFNIPVGIRAAMPLDFWGNRMACVITPEAFDDLGGIILIFHEFVHCYQWDTCELRLKGKMGLYRDAMQRKDYMWELQYKFPYEKENFQKAYEAMLAALEKQDLAGATTQRRILSESLTADEWDYMTWQEWKEGLARYLENALGARLGRPANRGGLKPPYNRVTFYAGGDGLIRALSAGDPSIANNIEQLYGRIHDLR